MIGASVITTLPAVDEISGPPRSGPVADDVDRLVALQHEVRQLTSRLAAWVQAQLVQAVDDRRNDLRALRTELQDVLDERVLAVSSQAAQAEERADALAATVEAEAARSTAFEERVRAAVVRLTDSIDGRLAGVDGLRSELRASIDTSREEALNAFRIELQGVLDERLRDVDARASRAADGLVALTSSVEAEAARTEAFEERVRSVVSRLTESVEALASTSTSRHRDVEALGAELRAELAEQLRSALVGHDARLQAVEEKQGREAERAGELMEGRLSGLVEIRRAELDAVRAEMQAEMARQLSEARSQMAAAIAGANKRFVRAHEQLGARMDVVAERAAGSGQKVDGVAEAVSSYGGRVEALELRIQSNDERLAEVVEERVVEVVGSRDAEIQALRAEMQGALSTVVAQVRSEMAAGTADTDRRLGATEARVDERLAGLTDTITGVVQAQVAAAAERRDAGIAAAASAETGALAPLRSDVRLLQARVSELAEALEEVRPRRRATPPTPVGRKAVAAPKPTAPKASPSKSKSIASKSASAAKRQSRATKERPQKGQ